MQEKLSAGHDDFKSEFVDQTKKLEEDKLKYEIVNELSEMQHDLDHDKNEKHNEEQWV